MGANIKLLALGDASHQGFNLGVICWCGHRGTIDDRLAWRWFMCHGWDTALPRIGRHLRCDICKKKDFAQRYGVSAGDPTPFAGYPRNEDGWKRLVRRLRG